jgi:hypothetical protein
MTTTTEAEVLSFLLRYRGYISGVVCLLCYLGFRMVAVVCIVVSVFPLHISIPMFPPVAQGRAGKCGLPAPIDVERSDSLAFELAGLGDVSALVAGSHPLLAHMFCFFQNRNTRRFDTTWAGELVYQVRGVWRGWQNGHTWRFLDN